MLRSAVRCVTNSASSPACNSLGLTQANTRRRPLTGPTALDSQPPGSQPAHTSCPPGPPVHSRIAELAGARVDALARPTLIEVDQEWHVQSIRILSVALGQFRHQVETPRVLASAFAVCQTRGANAEQPCPAFMASMKAGQSLIRPSQNLQRDRQFAGTGGRTRRRGKTIGAITGLEAVRSTR
jgi:hypothetical protein